MTQEITQITQDKFYKKPTEDCRGNCLQAAVASILGLQLEDVPDFHFHPDGFWGGFHKFLRERGFWVWEAPLSYHVSGYYLAYGPSARGVAHACVYRAGKLVWDPHPDRTGLESVTEQNVLIPFAPSIVTAGVSS